MNKLIFLFIALLLVMFVPTSTAQITNMTAQTGETWISWQWDSNNTTSVYVDGLFVVNSTLGTYTLGDLEPGSYHQLILIEDGIAFEDAQFTDQKTFFSNLLYILIFALIFLVISLKISLFRIVAILMFMYGGIVSLGQTSEVWMILVFWLSVIVCLFLPWRL